MMKFALPAAAALALAACAQEADNADNNVAGDEFTIDPSAMDDPATANLAINSSPTAADQAINQTEQQSDLANAIE